MDGYHFGMSTEERRALRGDIFRGWLLDFIADYAEEHGYAPSIRDMAIGLRVSSTSVIKYHLDVLERDGRIVRDRKRGRTVRIA